MGCPYHRLVNTMLLISDHVPADFFPNLQIELVRNEKSYLPFDNSFIVKFCPSIVKKISVDVGNCGCELQLSENLRTTRRYCSVYSVTVTETISTVLLLSDCTRIDRSLNQGAYTPTGIEIVHRWV